MSGTLEKQRNGVNLTNAKRMVVIGKLIDYLSESYYSTNELAKLTGLTRKMIDTYRPLADEVIGKQKLDRNVIRNLQVKRTYKLIEMLMIDLKACITIKEKTLIYNQIAKFSQHLALITGLNVETHVNVDHQQLVIIRADNNKRPVVELNETEAEREPEMVTIKDSVVNPKQGHTIDTDKAV